MAKIAGKIMPCTKRQKRSSGRLAESEAKNVGMAIRTIAGTITRLRPRRSAKMPIKGAVKATPRLVALTVMLTSPVLAPKKVFRDGRRGWVA